MNPIKIVEVPGGFNVYVNEVPIVRCKSGGMSFNRPKANLGKMTAKALADLTDEPFVFATPDKAMHTAHTLGRYILKMGDFVSGYTTYVAGPTMDSKTFWVKAFE